MRGNYPSARDLRRERLAGNWGGASDHIGRRWEEVGLEALEARVASGASWPADGYTPKGILELAGSSSLQLALSRSGLPSPDVIMILGNGSGHTSLQALDFKWNLEYASYSQISAEALRTLVERDVAPLTTLLAEAVEESPEKLLTVDGLLFSPDLPVNRWFLQSEPNQRQEYPIEDREVLFEQVDPQGFFGPLPGWEMATRLARLDRSESRLRYLDSSEHYYRVGAGLLGAVAQLQVSVFVRQPPTVEVEAALEWLRARVKPTSSDTLLHHTERLMATRGQLMSRLRNLTRSPYRFADLAENLKSRGIPLPDREDGLPAKEKEQWGELLRKVAVEHKEIVYSTGLRLVQGGLADTDALVKLEGEAQRFASRARNHADRLITLVLREAGSRANGR